MNHDIKIGECDLGVGKHRYPVARYHWFGNGKETTITLHDEFCQSCKQSIFSMDDWIHIIEHELVEIATIELLHSQGELRTFKPDGFNMVFKNMHERTVTHKCDNNELQRCIG